jgi:shikimate dehydrogenase
VAHSLSPVLHRAAYDALGLDWSYEAIECDETQLPEVLSTRADWAGFSCTMPLKRALLNIADEVAPIARAVGAGNTLLPLAGGGWRADNTDVAGMVAALAEHNVAAESATLLGAGGTAQAAIVALAAHGVRSCTVLVRDPARTAEVRAVAELIGLPVTVDVLGNTEALGADLIVSTLPAGAADQFAGRGWRVGQSLFDVVYSPWPTPLAAAAASAGATVVSGALMLLHQAAAQVALMTGAEPPVPAMRLALAEAAPGCGV